ncbi:MAG: hypothetical protein JSS10_09050 [Verrucomicrobia bacterium]|nr:hypothetical protein [Verrucomicrobiota bacterium]
MAGFFCGGIGLEVTGAGLEAGVGFDAFAWEAAVLEDAFLALCFGVAEEGGEVRAAAGEDAAFWGARAATAGARVFG